MAGLPLRRFAVYVAAGVLVVGVGVWGLLAARQGGSPRSNVVLDTGSGGSSPTSAAGGPDGAPGTTTTTARRIYVQVLGAVRRPGVYALPLGSRVFEAVKAAGGTDERADDQAVPLAALVVDGGRIVVPERGQTGASSPVTTSPSGGDGARGSTPGATTEGATTTSPLSLSTATVEELDRLPGIGPALAQRIVAFRESRGGFTSVDQLDEVSGVGPATLARLRDLVTP
jgi:competence protein ComEA